MSRSKNIRLGRQSRPREGSPRTREIGDFMKKLGLALIALALLSLGSCALLTGTQNTATTPSSLDLKAFQKSFMSSYYAERSGAPSGVADGPRALTPFTASVSSGAKTTVSLDRLASKSFAAMVGKTTTIYGDFPEPGQTTQFTVNLASGTPSTISVYDVQVMTFYPSTDFRKSYFEEYYIQDVGLDGSSNSGFKPDGIWTIDDPVVKKVGSSWASPDSSGYLTQDQSARVSMVLTFRDGSSRNETIISSSLSGGPLFDPAQFDISGSLDLSQVFIPKTVSSTPPLSSGVKFSSVVMYYITPSTNYNFWFWQGQSNQTILGVRYYTEVADSASNSYTTYTLSFEKTLGDYTTTGGTFSQTMQDIFVGSTFDTLAESVLRQQVIYGLGQNTSGTTTYYVSSGSGAAMTNMQTRVANITGKKDFYLTQLNSNQIALNSWATSTIYIPTGDVTEVLAETPANTLYTRTTSVSMAGGQPLVVSSSNISTMGLGDIAEVYASIRNGASSMTVSSAPPSNVMGDQQIWIFDGQTLPGTSISSVPVLTMKGTVEAWIYVNQMTDTMGIVHKGMAADFSDEAYSLQGWNNQGQIAFIVDNPGNSYDAVYSSSKINAKKWYYLVGTWDFTGVKKFINLYINGALTSTTTPTGLRATSGAADSSSNGLMVGSQLPVSYSSAYGYFGVDGKIAGVNITQSSLSAAEVLAKYNQYKGYTSSW
jgi:hypothetical protein